MKVAETHRTNDRHPQYLGGLPAHVGITFLFSAWYSLFSTPIVFPLVFLISKKEEKELSKEFGKEFQEYAEKAPMFLPRFRHREKKVSPYRKSPPLHKIMKKTSD